MKSKKSKRVLVNYHKQLVEQIIELNIIPTVIYKGQPREINKEIIFKLHDLKDELNRITQRDDVVRGLLEDYLDDLGYNKN